jgi:hypothetical protein
MQCGLAISLAYRSGAVAFTGSKRFLPAFAAATRGGAQRRDKAFTYKILSAPQVSIRQKKEYPKTVKIIYPKNF